MDASQICSGHCILMNTWIRDFIIAHHGDYSAVQKKFARPLHSGR